FSWAYAKKPRMMLEVLRGVRVLLANLIVFAPRRRVTMTLEAFPPDRRPKTATRETINPWLMKWYNAAGPEEPTYVPYHFLFGPRNIEYPPPWREADLDLAAVPDATKEAVAHFVEEKLKRPLSPEENKPETTFAELGIDSLDGMEIALAAEQQFG